MKYDVTKVLELVQDGLSITDALIHLDISKLSFYKSITLLDRKQLKVASIMNSRWPQPYIGVDMRYFMTEPLYRKAA